MTQTEMNVNIEVGSNLNRVDWMKNMTVTTYDQQAFSTPQETTPSGKFYIISRKNAMMSELLKDLLEDKAAGEIVDIPLPCIDGKTMSIVMMYVNYISNNKPTKIPKPLCFPIRDLLSAWETNFLNNYLLHDNNEKEHQNLINVLSASHYLNIESLTSLTCASVADMMKGKTSEQIRELFHIENDFTQEEEEQIRKETKWYDDAE